MLTIHDNSRQTFKRLLKKACLLSSQAISGTEGTTPGNSQQFRYHQLNLFTLLTVMWMVLFLQP